MLRRVGPDTFEGPTGDTVRIIAIAQDNGGVEAARFRYGTAQLPPLQIQGRPGCSFVVATPTTMFGCVVVFAPGAAGARYDLFEVLPNSTLSDLQVSVTPAFGPLVQFRIRGVAVAVAAAEAAPAAAFAAPKKKKTAKKRAARTKTAKKKKKTARAKKTSAAKRTARKRTRRGR
jgi:hypothetical protein